MHLLTPPPTGLPKINPHLGRIFIFHVLTSLPLSKCWLECPRQRLTKVSDLPIALDLRMSMTCDMRGYGGSPTRTTCRMRVYFTDTGMGLRNATPKS